MNHEETILEQALGIDSPPARDEFLREACGDNQVMFERLKGLLRAHERAGKFLEHNRPSSPSDSSASGVLSSGGAAPETAETKTPSLLSEQAGERIGRYKLLQKIGEGGCGVVYMAEQEEPVRRRVALKVIKLGMDTRSVVARFEAERQALAMMDHPNIAKVFDAGATGTALTADRMPTATLSAGRPYFVMELVRGVKITTYCDEQKLSTRQRLDLFIQVCQAVQHAHQKGIIHRDLKPSNILVTEQDGAPVPKIIDFGIAKATTDQRLTDKTLFTAFEQFIGTPAYMSPEQAGLGGLDIDTRSDIYSLGVLLYELLTGKPPFDSEKLAHSALDEILRTIREIEPPRPSARLTTLTEQELTTVARRRQTEAAKLPGLVRGDLDWVVMKALDKDRRRRYETVNGLARDLERYLGNEPVVARPPSNLYRLQKLARRNKLAFAAGAAVVGALSLGLGVATWSLVKERHARQRAAVEATKSGQVAEFLKEMFKTVDSAVAMGRDTTLLREILDRTAERIQREFANQPEVESDLGHTIATIYNELHEYKKAETLFRRGLALHRNLPGDQNRKIANSLQGLSHSLWRRGKNAEGEKVAREAIEIQKNLPNAEKQSSVGTYNCLGMTVRDQGRTIEAEAIFREGWAASHQRDRNLPFLLFSLAATLHEQRRFPEAEKIYKEGIAIGTNLNFVHQAIAEMHDNLASTLSAQGKGAEALIYLRQGVEMRKKLFGSDSPAVGDALRGLAWTLRKEGHLAEADVTQREALHITQKALARKDPEAVATVAGLAPALADAGRWTEVEPLIRDCRALAEEFMAVGQESFRRQRLSSGLAGLGRVLRYQTMYSEAEAISRYALALVDAEEPDYYNRVNDVALTLLAQDKLAEAEAMFKEALAANSRNPQHDHDLVVLLHNLGDALLGQGKVAEGKMKYAEARTAERVALARGSESGDPKAQNSLAWGMATSRDASRRDGKKAVELAKESVAASKRTNPMTLDTLAAAYAETGQFTNATAAQQEAIALLKEGPTKKDFERRLNLYALHLPFRDISDDDLAPQIQTLRQHRRFAEAETMLREALDALEAESRKEGNPEIVSALNYPSVEAELCWLLAEVYDDRGDYPKAEEWLRRALELQKTAFGEESEEVADFLHRLSWMLLEQGNRKKLAEAEKLARAAVAMKRKLLGNEAVSTANSLGLIAMVAGRKGDLAEAEEIQREVVRIWETTRGPANQSTLTALNNLAVTLTDQGKLAEAEAVYRRCWQGRTNQNRWLSAYDLRVLGNLAGVLNSQGKWAEAEAALTNLIALQGKQLSDTHPDVLGRMRQLANVMHQQNKLPEAQSIYRQALTLVQKAYGSNNLEVLSVRRACANVLRDERNWPEAEVELREVLRLIRKLDPDDTLGEADALRDLAAVLKRQAKLSEADKTYQEALQFHTALISNLATNQTEQSRQLLKRAELFTRSGRWNEGVADVKRAIDLKPNDDESTHQLPPLLLQSGDLQAYREHCRGQLERFGKTDKPVTAYRVAKDCLMVPIPGVDLNAAAGLADLALRVGRRPRDEFVKSLADYRQGHYRESAERLERLLTQPRRDLHLDIQARVVLAMVYHHLRRTDEAQTALAGAVALADKRLPKLDEPDLGDDSTNCIWVYALFKEANALLQ